MNYIQFNIDFSMVDRGFSILFGLEANEPYQLAIEYRYATRIFRAEHEYDLIQHAHS